MRADVLSLFGLGLVIAPAIAEAQHLPLTFPQFTTNRVAHGPTASVPLIQREHPSRWPYILTGAVLGGAISAVTLAPAVVEAEAGSEPLVYIISTASGAAVGALLGLLVSEIARGP